MFFRFLTSLILTSSIAANSLSATTNHWAHWMDKDLICVPDWNAISEDAKLLSENIEGNKQAYYFIKTEEKKYSQQDFVCYKSRSQIDPYSLVKTKLTFEIKDLKSSIQDHILLDKYFFHDGSLGLDKDNLLNLWAPRALDELLVYRKIKPY